MHFASLSFFLPTRKIFLLIAINDSSARIATQVYCQFIKAVMMLQWIGSAAWIQFMPQSAAAF